MTDTDAATGLVSYIARSLDEVNGNYYQILIENGICVNRIIKPLINRRIGENYGHFTLYKRDLTDGALYFQPLSYQPSEYPWTDISNVAVYEHKAEAKIWAICKQLLVFYQGAQTRNRLVCQDVDQTIDIEQRKNEKLASGYVLVGYLTFDCHSRKFK
jgi:hypothetical protein